MITEEQFRSANQVDLFRFLCKNHADKIIQEDNKVRLISNTRIIVEKQHSTYADLDTNESGSAIDLLVKYFEYSVDDAAATLAQGPRILIIRRRGTTPEIIRISSLPPREPEKCSRLYGYLHGQRGIPIDTLRLLLRENLIYQESSYKKRLVFVNKTQDYAETFPSIIYDRDIGIYRPFEGKYWSLCIGHQPMVAYVCQSAIDAISLYLLRHKEPAYYISVFMDDLQNALKRISVIPGLSKIVLAVNNTPEGKTCRDQNNHLEAIIPDASNWNEDLKNRLSTQ